MVIVCKQCGDAKPLTNYRKYYNNRKGYYKICKTCESINARYRYLLKKQPDLTDAEVDEMAKIFTLYDLLRDRGLQTPRFGTGRATEVTAKVEDLLKKNSVIVETMKRVEPEEVSTELDEIPADLQEWLDKPLIDYDPAWLIDDLYEQLRDKYLQTHKTVLEQILTRFYEYEEDYHNV